ncbi:uncharacterized protein PHALS_08767 [Plasmopara halstedii]|uniref:Uncharacterized protein n=1 Tax=Plasmopara halstedii TaxID=4781 RepID=A0A0P1AE93_PLAHL|nr:uncharacterized protein PHALS_08767 [Plasmopara halstedii]CEG38708.1 hypothetical protein PHALS_08767 [Plasmopara halstedii]|eukprot:XP_024575077.1 hypothetical protein PHALS_08767 [Plasmopara halstedii]
MYSNLDVVSLYQPANPLRGHKQVPFQSASSQFQNHQHDAPSLGSQKAKSNMSYPGQASMLSCFIAL